MANNNKNYHLQELGGSDFEIADGQPNIKGWDVKDENGKKIGEVDELLFDPQSQKVRYLVVDLSGNDFDLDKRDVLVPIGIAELHDEDDDVILPGVSATQLSALPDYDKDELGPDVEGRVRSAFAGLGSMGLAGAAVAGSPVAARDDDFYSHEHFNEDRLYKNMNRDTTENNSIPVIEENLEVGKKEVDKGGLRLRSRIVEQDVSEDVNLRQEKVTIERNPVDRPATPADIREENVEMIERAEVPVVNKEARVVEEVSLDKDVTEREETIRDTVKKTEVDVDKLGNTENDVNRNVL
jgi:uncharacterized protein (TIGR02271 family)